MIATVYSLVFAIMVFFFYSDYCNPVNISANLGSAFSFLDEVLSYQAWMIPVMIFFWPTIREHEDEKSFSMSSTFVENMESMLGTGSVLAPSDNTADFFSPKYQDVQQHQELPKFKASISTVNSNC